MRALIPRSGFVRVGSWVNGAMWASADGLKVISSVHEMYLPGTGDTLIGPTWLVSVSRSGHRCTDADIAYVIDRFEMPAFDEDNHSPGISRALFCPVDPDYRHACECKTTEILVVEADGYTWSADRHDCGACRLDRILTHSGYGPKPCPIHGS